MGESRPVAALGPFSAGSAFPAGTKVGQAFPRPWAPSRRWSTSKVKKEEDGGPESSKKDSHISHVLEDGVRIKYEDGGFISSEEDEHQGPRKDIDFINLISDEEGDAEGGSARLNSPALMPVRIRRIEHKDRAPPVSAEASGVAMRIKQLDSDGDVAMEDVPSKPVRKGKQRAQDGKEHETQRRWRGVYQDEDEDDLLVDEEPSEDQPLMSSPKQPRSPGKSKRGKAHQRPDSPVFQTEEERQEHERQQNQIDILKAELGGVRLESDEPIQDKKADQIYIFQFPPKLPSLTNASAQVKDEPESPPLVPANRPASDGAAATPASITAQNSVPIKIEDDAPVSSATTFSFSRSAHLPTLTPGLVGKLKIHKSGKATLDWGGTSLRLNKAMDASFLQDVVMVRPATQQSAAEGSIDLRSDIGGEALAFGQVRGKFAVAPDWEEMWG